MASCISDTHALVNHFLFESTIKDQKLFKQFFNDFAGGRYTALFDGDPLNDADTLEMHDILNRFLNSINFKLKNDRIILRKCDIIGVIRSNFIDAFEDRFIFQLPANYPNFGKNNFPRIDDVMSAVYFLHPITKQVTKFYSRSPVQFAVSEIE